MNPSDSEELDETPKQFDLKAILCIVLAAVLGTILAVWAFHFMHLGKLAATGKPFPRIAILPLQSIGASQEEIGYDRKLTDALIGGLSRISRVEKLPTERDTDPVAVGHELGVRLMLMGKVERQGTRVRVEMQMVSARDGSQVWAGSFDGDPDDPSRLSTRIDTAVAPHLTALLD